jgi:uncharacterized membrane protein
VQVPTTPSGFDGLTELEDTMDTLPLHPKLVHLPIALAVLMPLITSGLLLAWFKGWFPRRTWAIAAALQLVLAGTAFAAMRTGEETEEQVGDVVPDRAVEVHEETAEVFTWTAAGITLLALLALGVKDEKSARAAAIVTTAGTLVVLFLGYRVGEAGGRLVYEHGAAQPYVDAARTGVPLAGEGGEEGEEGHDD